MSQEAGRPDRKLMKLYNLQSNEENIDRLHGTAPIVQVLGRSPTKTLIIISCIFKKVHA